MASTQESPDPLEQAAAAYRTDKPSITDAMKNFSSVLAAADLSGPVHELPHLLTCAKVVLRQINEHTLQHPQDWAEAHPQGEEETGAARIEALTQYKVVHLLSVQVRESGGKVTKLLGRRFLQTSGMTDAVGEKATDLLRADASLPPATVEAFLDGWEDAVLGDDEQLASLVWAADFSRVLAERKAARLAEVAERRERLDASEDEAQRLREAMAAEAIAPEERVVEVADDDEDLARTTAVAEELAAIGFFLKKSGVTDAKFELQTITPEITAKIDACRGVAHVGAFIGKHLGEQYDAAALNKFIDTLQTTKASIKANPAYTIADAGDIWEVAYRKARDSEWASHLVVPAVAA